MVMFASLIGAAAVYARLASAGPVVEHAYVLFLNQFRLDPLAHPFVIRSGRQYGYGSASSSSA
jgi:hypothetical protein